MNETRFVNINCGKRAPSNSAITASACGGNMIKVKLGFLIILGVSGFLDTVDGKLGERANTYWIFC